MADKILSMTKCAEHWDVAYEVEKNALKNQFCVVVLKADMTDEDSEAEAKTLANVQAAAKKDAWPAAASTSETVLSTPEDVAL